jgi:hypothetical protein
MKQLSETRYYPIIMLKPNMKSTSDHDLLIRLDARTIDLVNGQQQINKNFENITSIFASKEQLKEVARQTEIRISLNEKDISILKGPKKYLNMVLTSVITFIFTFLVASFLGRIK